MLSSPRMHVIMGDFNCGFLVKKSIHFDTKLKIGISV